MSTLGTQNIQSTTRKQISRLLFKPDKSIVLVDTSILYIQVYLKSIKTYLNSLQTIRQNEQPRPDEAGPSNYRQLRLTPIQRRLLSRYQSKSNTSVFSYRGLFRDPKFLRYFEEKFMQKMVTLLSVIPDSDIYNVVFVKDTSLRTNWRRTEIFDDYKANRKPMAEYIPEISSYFWNKIFVKLSVESGCKIVSYEHLEADDIIYLISKKIREMYPNQIINIITNDRDYLQIADARTNVYKTNGFLLENSENSKGDALLDKAIKILSGDVSDNIKPIYKGCGEVAAYTIIRKLYLNKRQLKVKEETMLEENVAVQRQYLGEMFRDDLLRIPELSHRIFSTLSRTRQESADITAESIEKHIEMNARLIDLDRIPQKYKDGFYGTYKFSVATNKSARKDRSA